MTSKETVIDLLNCGADCGACQVGKVLRDGMVHDCWWFMSVTIIPYGENDSERVVVAMPHIPGHCPKCGRPVGFSADGTPTVGESYAELEIDARRMRKLDADGPTIDGYGGAYYTHHGEFAKLSDLADALPDQS
jgi:hypothetical protein